VTGLPDPRPDGMCAECGEREAKTNDGRFCKKCIGLRLLNEYSSLSNLRDLSRKGTEEIDRAARDTKSLGGSAELNDDGDDMSGHMGVGK